METTKMELEPHHNEETKPILLHVRYGGKNYELKLPASRTLRQLQELIQEETGVLIRMQKLLGKGKTIVAGDPEKAGSLSLMDVGLVNGSKILLISRSSNVTPTLGASALNKKIEERKEQRLKLQEKLTANKERKQPQQPGKANFNLSQKRLMTWSKTGIVSLRDLKLYSLPEEMFEDSCCRNIKVADIGGNRLKRVPEKVCVLSSLQKLRLSSNQLDDEGVPWNSLATLPNLSVLALESNLITKIPDSIGKFVSLETLRLGNNRIDQLPDSVLGCLVRLRALDLHNNCLTSLPATLSDCSLLEEMDCSMNQIREVPKEFGKLVNLRILLIDNNRIETIPTEILKGCLQLNTLSLKDNPITIQQMREIPGFCEFEERRRTKYDKKIDMKVLLDRDGFSEAADSVHWEKFKD